MKITNTEKDGSMATVTLELSRETVEAGKTKAYNKAKKDILLPGFRKGHAPRRMIESFYGTDIFLEDAIDEIYPQIVDRLTESGLKIVGMGNVSKLDKLDGGAVALTVQVPTYPEVTLGQYKGLSVPKEEVEVTEEEINAEIDRMAEQVSSIENVEREARDGDTVNIDYAGFADGVAFEGGTAEDQDLTLGSGSFIPGFEEQLVGMSIGEERDIDVTFPEEYHAEDLAGKPAVFHVKLNGVKETVRPALDDEFVKDVSEFDTMDELRADIRARFAKEKQERIDKEFRAAALELAAAETQADIPGCMVDEELNYELRQTAYQLEMNGMDMEQYASFFGGEAQMKQAMRPGAYNQVKKQVMLAKIAEVEAIEITEEEIEAEYARLAEAYAMEVEEIKARMGVEDVKTDLLAVKAADLIVANAIPTAPKAEEAEAVEVEEAEVVEVEEAAETETAQAAEK